MYRKFYRSRKNRLLAGVCGGIGEYFNIDPTIVRILWVLISLNGIGIAAYIICAIIIPDEDFSDSQSSGQFNDTKYNFNPEK
ncbi:MAG TPA: hypothetical protein DD426_09065, partial [Clostridiaceae bacterium]|nr:hypothetical protein [Clostridiaceae bacterium]